MKRILLTALSISSMICSFGQKNIGIKIHQNTDLFEAKYYESITGELTRFNNVNFNRISFAVNIDTKQGYTHEIELLIPELLKPLDNIQFPLNYEFRKGATFEGQASSYSLRYELSKTLTNQTKRFCFNLGLGINPYYVHLEYIPNVETTFYWSTKLYGLVLNMVPRIKYKISQRIGIDLNVPLKIYDLRGEKNRIKNPAMPINRQTNKENNNIFFESAYTIRLGVMYRLS